MSYQLRKLAFALGVTTLALVIGCMLVFRLFGDDLPSPHPTEDVLLRTFLDNKPLFENALAELTGAGVASSRTLRSVGLPEEQQDIFRAQFRPLDLEGDIEGKADAPGIVFIVASRRFGDADPSTYEFEVTEKGYAYISATCCIQSDSLNERQSGGAELVFRPVAENWYLYFERSYGKPE